MARAILPTVLIFVSPIAGQEVVVPVGDLIRVSGLEAGAGSQPWITRFFAFDENERSRQWAEDLRFRGFLGEAEFVGLVRDDAEREAYFSEQGLEEFLSTLMDVESGIRVYNDELRAPAQLEGEVRRALTALRTHMPVIDYEIRLERIGSDSPDLLLSGTQRDRDARPNVFADVQKRHVVWDYSVEIAQASSMANPQVAENREGVCLAVDARLSPGRSFALVQAIVRVVDPLESSMIELGHPGFGDLDRVNSTAGEAALTWVASPGETSVHEWRDAEGRTLRLTSRITWEPATSGWSAGAVMNGSLLSGDPPLEFDSPRRRAFPWLDDSWEIDEREARWSRAGEILWATLQESAGSMSMVESDGGSRVIAVSGASAPEFVATADGELRRALAGVDLDISVVDVPVGSTGGPARILAAMSGPVVAAFPSSFSGDRERSYLRDWNTEVAQASRIPEPIIDILTTGYGLTALVRVDQEGRPRAVDIHCDVRRFEDMRSRELPLDQAMFTMTPSIFVPSIPTTAANVVKIEQPATREHRVVLTIPIDEGGTAVLRRTVRSFTGPGRELVVTVRAVGR